MAKILCNYFGLSMAAEGKSDFVGRQAAAFLGYVQQDAERCAANCGSAEDLSAAPEEIWHRAGLAAPGRATPTNTMCGNGAVM